MRNGVMIRRDVLFQRDLVVTMVERAVIAL